MKNIPNKPDPVPIVLCAGTRLKIPEPVQKELRRAGYQVELVTNTADLLKKAKDETDVILLDDALSDQEGHLALELLKKDPLRAEIPVLLIGDRADEAELEHALVAGAHDCLPAPLTSQDLSLKLKAITRFRRVLHRAIRPWAYARAVELETRTKLFGESAYETRWGFRRTPEGPVAIHPSILQPGSHGHLKVKDILKSK